MQKIYLITDYKEQFGTKYTALPYRGGLDKSLLLDFFGDKGYLAVLIKGSDLINGNIDFKNGIFIYSSSEDIDSRYKSFLEDVLYEIHRRGGRIFPSYEYFKAHNNKVYFEILNKSYTGDADFLESKVYGTLEEMMQDISGISLPVIVKTSSGFKSRGVFKATSQKELVKYARKSSRSKSISFEIKDYLRSIIHKAYIKESRYRNKFILQQFIPGLKNDWKVLVYGRKYYVLFRENRKNDFRASGSGKFSYPRELPDGFLDYCEKLYRMFNVPHASFDIASDGESFYLFEAQFVYFGTYTLEHSSFWFSKTKGKWIVEDGESVLEREYVDSMIFHIEQKEIS